MSGDVGNIIEVICLIGVSHCWGAMTQLRGEAWPTAVLAGLMAVNLFDLPGAVNEVGMAAELVVIVYMWRSILRRRRAGLARR